MAGENEKDQGQGQSQNKVLPLEIKIVALGTDINVTSNSSDPKMVLMGLHMAIGAILKDCDVKKTRLVEPVNVIPMMPRMG